MKKLIAALFVGILTTAGLVAVTSTAPASAACGGKYNPCVKTKTTAAKLKPVKAGKKAKISVSVKPASGRAPVNGTVTITIKGGGKTIKVTVKVRNGKAVYTTPKLRKKGTYKVTISFKPAANSNALPSKSSTTIKVKK
ncbi:Ig-like domain repeat protein [Nocardioides lianchengensis]|uniref:Ig-like domain (Group 3) n=1 Tax=Nocardioides lianchengensis TaxID=1045774 RepID=A0A1G7AZ32_9ACTN|nr:Ig-like domain repeat protein [Nocardioides lianchengensis]NYG13350.1 hypothetical protein [Nocardioides lianchengensis]SDE19837.1 Ig-like domain (group 3) [Nocardioides lianchengensis]